jgi:hypothetical protein
VSKPADFQARNQFDVWVPLALDLEKLPRNTHPVRVFARLVPGVTVAQAQVDLNAVAANLARRYPQWNLDRGSRWSLSSSKSQKTFEWRTGRCSARLGWSC